jgi:hypothetical protein
VAGFFGDIAILTEDCILVEAPPPVLLNSWKHHAGMLKLRVRDAIVEGEPSLDPLARKMVVIGSELMDLYAGPLTPGEIAAEVVAGLSRADHLEASAYRAWLKTAGGYAMLPLSDGCEWVLRGGDESDRYVHIHPGRWTPRTCRVRANVLKTAVMALAFTGIRGGNPLDVSVVNEVRRQYLGLAPLGRNLSGDQGIGSIIDLLR